MRQEVRTLRREELVDALVARRHSRPRPASTPNMCKAVRAPHLFSALIHVTSGQKYAFSCNVYKFYKTTTIPFAEDARVVSVKTPQQTELTITWLVDLERKKCLNLLID